MNWQRSRRSVSTVAAVLLITACAWAADPPVVESKGASPLDRIREYLATRDGGVGGADASTSGCGSPRLIREANGCSAMASEGLPGGDEFGTLWLALKCGQTGTICGHFVTCDCVRADGGELR